MTTRDHSRIAPSGLHITVECPLSLTLQEQTPELPPTEEILTGTATHLVVAAAAQGDVWPVGRKFESEGRGWEVTVDMAYAARIYAKTVNTPPPNTYAAGQLVVERRVEIARIHPECWGTPDVRQAFTLENQGQHIRVVDYKNGHRYVDPWENPQGIGYLTGVLSELGISTGDDKTVVEFTTVQPFAYHRNGPVQSWFSTPFGMVQLISELRQAVTEALGPNPEGFTGPHCLDCRARAACPLLRKSVSHIVDYVGTAEIEHLDNMTAGQELRILDDAAERIKARRTGLALRVENDLRKGQAVPYYGLEPVNKNLKWRKSITPEQIEFLGMMSGVNLKKPDAYVTPSQAVQLGIDATVIDEYSDREPSGMALKPDGNKASKIFGGNA